MKNAFENADANFFLGVITLSAIKSNPLIRKSARRAGQDLEVVRCAEPLILPSRLPRVVGEAVVGNQQVAGKRLADRPLCDHRHVVERVEVAGVQPSGELVEVSLGVLRRHLAEGSLHGPLQLGPGRFDGAGALSVDPIRGGNSECLSRR